MKQGIGTVVKNIIRRADVVLEILDARMPELTRNSRMEALAKSCGRRVVLVINKIDLLSPAARKQLESWYLGKAVPFSAKRRFGVPALIRAINAGKGAPKKIAVIGYPNTGKSSIINLLSAGGKAKTSSESGYTRGLQLIKGKEGLMLFDTPGIVPFEDRDEIRLGLIAGVSPSKLEDPDIVACALIELFLNSNPEALAAYGAGAGAPEEILVGLAEKWNMRGKGGVADEKRAAIKMLMDWHAGKLKL
jgi:ribosome biogenesis GTPase A